jgi:protoheme IX farnesyltransferase
MTTLGIPAPFRRTHTPRAADLAHESLPETAPGPWLRLTALAGAGACALVVAAASLGLASQHSLLAVLGLPPLVALTVAARVGAHRRLRTPSLVALLSFLATIASGGLAQLEPGLATHALHVGLAALTLAAALVAAAQALREQPAPRAAWRDYLTLTKPRIMTLLLWTGACGMIAGAHGLPSPGLFVAAMAGLALACGGASALNHVLDADIDRLMGSRTDRRPVAAGRVPPTLALEFGLVLSALSFVLLGTVVNLLTAALALVGNLFYVLVYTRWLKRSTPQNIVIGGAAGAIPPLVGWAAASGSVALPALALFAIVFFWTPPHFWALALMIRREYQRARVPMLPVVRGEAETVRQILLYSALLLLVTVAPFLLGLFGIVYLVGALLLGALFLALAWRLRVDPGKARAAMLFHYSLLYLALVFAAAALDAAA